MPHAIYWRRSGPPGSAVTFVIACPDGCPAHPPGHMPGHMDVLGILDPGRAAWYADLGAIPAWLRGWGLPGAALLATLRLAARDPNASAGWVTRRGRWSSRGLREGW